MKRIQQGVGLVEILVALLVLSISVLGYAGLQLQALDSTDQAYERSQATALGQDLSERIMANPSGESEYTNDGNWPSDPPGYDDHCIAQQCSPARMAQWDIDQLSFQADQLLPNGRINAVACEGSSATCIQVSWNETDLQDCQDDDGAVAGIDCTVLEVVP